MFCTSCGTQNLESAFCTNCGAALTPIAPTANGMSAPPSAFPQATAYPSMDAQTAPGSFAPPVGKSLIKNPSFFIPVGIVSLALIVGVAMGLGGKFGTSPMASAVDECNLQDSVGADLADDGWTLVLDSAGEDEYSGIAFSDVQCVMDAIPVPADIQARIMNTSGMDGQQTDSFDGISISWSYRSSTGVSMIFGKD